MLQAAAVRAKCFCVFISRPQYIQYGLRQWTGHWTCAGASSSSSVPPYMPYTHAWRCPAFATVCVRTVPISAFHFGLWSANYSLYVTPQPINRFNVQTFLFAVLEELQNRTQQICYIKTINIINLKLPQVDKFCVFPVILQDQAPTGADDFQGWRYPDCWPGSSRVVIDIQTWVFQDLPGTAWSSNNKWKQIILCS